MHGTSLMDLYRDLMENLVSKVRKVCSILPSKYNKEDTKYLASASFFDMYPL